MPKDFIHLHFLPELEKVLSSSESIVDISGTDSKLAIGLLLGALRSRNQLPFVIVVETERDLSELNDALNTFHPDLNIQCLLEHDVSPYSGLYPRSKNISSRLSWCHYAQTSPETTVFIATHKALCQITLPVETLFENTHEYRINDEFPEEIHEFLETLGFTSSPAVEDVGTYAVRGGILDIYSPAHEYPIRIELFGESIESLRFFDPITQRSMGTTDAFVLIPNREVLFANESDQIRAAQTFKEDSSKRNVEAEDAQHIQRSIARGQYTSGIEFLVHYFYGKFTSPLEYFSEKPVLINVNARDLKSSIDELLEHHKEEFNQTNDQAICPPLDQVYRPLDQIDNYDSIKQINFSKVEITDQPLIEGKDSIQYPTSLVSIAKSEDPTSEWVKRIFSWKEINFRTFIFSQSENQTKRIKLLFDNTEFKIVSVVEEFEWDNLLQEQDKDKKLVHLLPFSVHESIRIQEERLVFLKDGDLLGRQPRKKKYKESGSLAKRVNALNFADLHPGENIVHSVHGVGVYEGLKTMDINGVESEFLELTYKDKDRLYLPIYRVGQIQKYTGGATKVLDKLGGKGFEKTKGKVKKRLREIAAELITLYAKRREVTRPVFDTHGISYGKFEGNFPFEETEDQQKAIDDIFTDFERQQPMDRLVCGDVGFGKTEVAMRAAFIAVQNGFQVAVLAPTTILTFQHTESFLKRFKGFNFKIKSLNRFVPTKEAKKIIQDLKDGEVDIVVGTHRLLSKDVGFSNLGLLIVDEEQKFGVTHKERIRQLKTSVDTLAMSATPIPRTLNMSLTGLRDLSIINTAPVDRLPTRTFVTRFNKETIKKAIESEVSRGGQVFFLHNRVQTIYLKASELREIVPNIRISIGHGQMDEKELEKTMVDFLNKEIDLLLCTTIIESGIDIPNANTMFIDDAQNFGLSQLYQLRGRVGRSKRRAYCYLLVPKNKKLEKEAQERLKVIQEHTALGSGLMIAQHDLELRGAGTLLGEEQSGHIQAVGYEMFLELLDEALKETKGEEIHEKVEPEINLKIPALIPSRYIPDIRIRLSFYKRLADIDSYDDVDTIEEELRDQFGKPPEEVINLLGVMLIRFKCKELGVQDLSAGAKTISLSFTDKTPLAPEEVIRLTAKENKKFSITPDNRFIIRMNQIEWPKVLDELEHLLRLCR